MRIRDVEPSSYVAILPDSNVPITPGGKLATFAADATRKGEPTRIDRIKIIQWVTELTLMRAIRRLQLNPRKFHHLPRCDVEAAV